MSRERALELAVSYASVRIDITGDGVVAAAKSFFDFLSSNDVAVAGAPTKDVAAPAKPATKPAAKPAATKPAPAPAQTQEPAATAAPEVAEETAAPEAPPAVTQEAVKAAIGAAASNPGVGAVQVRAVLTKNGATNLTTLKPEKYGDVVSELNKLIEAAAALTG